jgi:hypothetical protein
LPVLRCLLDGVDADLVTLDSEVGRLSQLIGSAGSYGS